jgi:hypothetical protein
VLRFPPLRQAAKTLAVRQRTSVQRTNEHIKTEIKKKQPKHQDIEQKKNKNEKTTIERFISIDSVLSIKRTEINIRAIRL